MIARYFGVLILVLTVWLASGKTYAQNSLNPVNRNELFPPDSLSEVLFSEFLLQYNHDTIEFSKLLKNSYVFYASVISSYVDKKPGIGFLNEKEFVRDDLCGLEFAEKYASAYLKDYRQEVKRIKILKRKKSILRRNDFLPPIFEWKGDCMDYKYSLIITYVLEAKLRNKFKVQITVFSNNIQFEEFISITRIE